MSNSQQLIQVQSVLFLFLFKSFKISFKCDSRLSVHLIRQFNVHPKQVLVADKTIYAFSYNKRKVQVPSYDGTFGPSARPATSQAPGARA